MAVSPESPAPPESDAFPRRPLRSKVPFVSAKPPPIPSEPQPSPEYSCSWWSTLTFGWVYGVMRVGYSRPLESSDLWRISDERSADVYAQRITEAFERRKTPPRPPKLKAFWWRLRGRAYFEERQHEWTEAYEPSLLWAMNDAVFSWFWIGGLMRLVADVGQMLSPLLVKALINYAKKSYHVDNPPPIGEGVGLAVGLLALLWVILLANSHSYYRMYTTGVILRAGLIAILFRQGMLLSNRGMAKIGSASRLTTLLSSDISRIDFSCAFFHQAWTGPIQIIVCLVILCVNLGWAALPGFALFLLGGPMQAYLTGKLFLLRKRSMTWTDKRIKVLTEVMGNMRLVKLFAWEVPFVHRISEYRHEEMRFLRQRLVLRAVNNALAFSLPTLSAVVSFVSYAAAGNGLDPALIFSSLSLFNLLRSPLQALPVAFNAIADSASAVTRIQHVLTADVVPGPVDVDEEMGSALRVDKATFEWEDLTGLSGVLMKPVAKKNVGPVAVVRWAARQFKRAAATLHPRKQPRSETSISETVGEKAPSKGLKSTFQIRDVSLAMPHGALWAVVGPVGSGKSSFLQGLIGEMPRTTGSVVFGGKVAYCPQVAWIQSCSIRDNITFGQSWDEEKYWRVCRETCLLPDFDMFTDGDRTMVGEKGISLSGGQKQRINIARALYFDAPITLFDDSFSALDAHVGHAVFQNAILGSLRGRTRILVTHALHFLPHMDRILVLDRGVIAEEGAYDELITRGGTFSTLIKDFGTNEAVGEQSSAPETVEAEVKGEGEKKKVLPAAALMQVEERYKGSVGWQTYKEYFQAGRMAFILPLLIISITVFQGSSVLSPYWLVFWQNDQFDRPQGFYMGIYTVLGVAQALGLFFMGSVFAIFSFNASRTLHRNALQRVIHAPSSFFDTTPLGTIMNRFSKDVDLIDNIISDAVRMLMGTLVQSIGSIVLVSVSLPWFLIAIAVICVMYHYLALFYRASSREFKRLDAILRSSLYAHFSESMTGLSTIRAYGETPRFVSENTFRIDEENRAYWLSVSNQRWLSTRLDFLGSLSIFAVAMLTVGTRTTLNPADTGVVLSYMLVVQQSFAWLVRQTAEVENSMNGIERILYYANHVEQEAAYDIPKSDPPPQWPTTGDIIAEDMVVAYRPGLPPVLKGVSMHVESGEHVGIIGRTGAGKSTITLTMFRIIELLSGRLIIDGVDVSKIGLHALRSKLSIIPQDPLLFHGTMRTNLDPFGLYDDAKLWAALKRACLVRSESSETSSLDEKRGSDESGGQRKLTLDTELDAGGTNLSVGQRSLVSFARALVKDSRIILLDEATASIDYSTDHAIQQTIINEFADRTLLCIAHRLNTIIGYDRILVMDAGQVAEFDTPEALFAKEDSIFKSMCDRSRIGLEDIRAARKARLLGKGV